MLKINFKQETKDFIFAVIRYLFLFCSVLFVIFSFAELVKPRIILSYLNLDVFLLILIILGALSILMSSSAKPSQKLEFLDHSAIILFSILFGILILYLARNLGLLCILLGIASAIICYFFIILNFKSEQND
jgi:NADH:ubiquinone oxidoreductase subunit 2 (subunit N)